MECQFENQYIRTKELIKEPYFYHYYKKPFYILTDIFLYIMFIGNIILGLWQDIWQINIFFIIFFLLLFKYFLYYRSYKTLIKRDFEINNGEPIQIKIATTDEGIFIGKMDSTDTIVNFNQIKKVFKTNSLIIFKSHANLWYIFHKDGFTKGTLEDFENFIMQKGFKLRH